MTRMANDDAPLFAAKLGDYPVPITVLPAARTNSFRMLYDGEERQLVVDCVGDPWTTDDVDAASINTEWVHIAPLLRDEFPVATLRHLVEAGHRISFDGQGLVRKAAIGTLREDDRYDPAILSTLTILKVSEEEAAIVAGGLRPGVPEVVTTLGSAGCDICTGGGTWHVPATRLVFGVHTTGAGDVFAVAYVALRASGMAPADAAVRASTEVAEMLDLRRRR